VSTVKIGDKCRVRIFASDTYAVGAAKSLDGKTGVVEKMKIEESTGHRLSVPKVLVKFNTPAKKWSTNQSPCLAFWFDINELEWL
jgi:hypothetical protein